MLTKMDLERDIHIPELYDLYHRNDNNLHTGNDFKENVLVNSLSANIFKNDITNGYLLYLQDMVAHMINSNVIIRNWFCNSTSKYYDKHNN